MYLGTIVRDFQGITVMEIVALTPNTFIRRMFMTLGYEVHASNHLRIMCTLGNLIYGIHGFCCG